MKTLALLSLVLCSVGCSSGHMLPPPDSGAIVIPSDAGSVVIIPNDAAVSRKDLPSGFTEVRLDDWSYGVPSGFLPLPLDGGTILAQSNSFAQKLTISFEKVATKLTDLHQYVLSDFVLLQMGNGAEILQERTRTANGEETVAVQVLQKKVSSSQVSSLDFFRLKGGNIYHLSCFGEATDLQANSDVCFQIENTLLIAQ